MRLTSLFNDEESFLTEQEILAIFKKYFNELVEANPILRQYEQHFRYMFFMGFNEAASKKSVIHGAVPTYTKMHV